SAAADKVVCFWDAATGKMLRQLQGIVNTEGSSLAVSPDGKVLAAVEQKESPPNTVGGEQPLPSILLRHTAGGKVLRRLSVPVRKHPYGGTNSFRCVAFSPDGKTLAGGGIDVGVHVWDVKTGAERASFAPDKHQTTLAF